MTSEKKQPVQAGWADFEQHRAARPESGSARVT